MSYYTKELSRLKEDQGKSIKLVDGWNATRWLCLNEESIPAIIQWLEKELEQVKQRVEGLGNE